MPAVIIAVLFIPSFNIWNSYFYISLNFVVVCTVQILVNFVITAPLKLLIKSFSFQYKLEGGLYKGWLIIRYFLFIGRWVYNCGKLISGGGGCLKAAGYVFFLIYKICISNAVFQGSNPIHNPIRL